MGRAGLPPCCLTWGQTMVEIMKIMAPSFRRSHAQTSTLSASNPAAGLHWPTPLPETAGHSWASLGQSLVGHCSFLLGPGAHKLLFVPSKSLFLLSCVSSGSPMVGLMVTCSKRACAIPRSAAPRAPAGQAGHDWPVPSQDTLTHSSGSVMWSVWVLVHTGLVGALWVSLAWKGFDSKCDFTPPIVLLGLLLCPWMWGIFFLVGSKILQTTVV